MIRNIFKSTAIASLGALLLLGGCTSNFEDINTDPDALETGSPTNQLGYVLRYTASQYGAIDATESWAGYMVKIQYMDNYSYLPTDNTYGNKFACSYRCNVQLDDVLKQTEANADEFKNIRWAVRIWKEFLWLWCTDQFGAIPYTEANKIEEGTVKGKYDSQEVIYTAILKNLKTIADEMAAETGSDKIGEGDFLFNGDVDKWRKFCNSLRLRAAMRIVNVAPELARSTVEEIGSNLSTYPVLDSSNDNAYFNWQGSSPYFEPWYDNFRTRDDHGMSNIFVAHLTSTKDPRISTIMKPAESDNEYRGYENGALAAPSNLKTISRMGEFYRENPSGFTPFLKSCENYFIMAEASLRGWNVSLSAQEAYETAVKISMDDNNVAAADAEAYLAGAGKWDNTLDRVYMEEWVALFKNNLEAWSLYRRTGYPKAIQTSGEYPGKFSIYGTSHTDVPFRMPYPDNEYLYNADNLNAVTSGLVDYVWGEKMWWDTRTGVK
ncbi:MAG: SusD/RagB family nutrient-binding outer membrane lipoprotein [Parabacteroides sp.]|nr:SusD/RagB family nutrient-binding outer membrane lipoprotein [Parabacteroides sp.]